MYSGNGRKLESWEYNPSDLCEKAGILGNTPMGLKIFSLSCDELIQLTSVFDPEQDILVHVDSQGFSVNHGSVGQSGVAYSFR